MRMIRAHSGAFVVMLCGVLVLLAACGGQGQTPSRTSHAAATATTNPKYASTPPSSITPTPEPHPPYAFPHSWRNAPGSLLLAGPNNFAFAPSNQQIGYACAGATSQAQADKLYVTHDGGASWNLSQGQPGGCGSVFVDAQDASDVFVAAGSSPDQLWRSRNGGATWTQLGPIPSVDTGPLGWADVAVVGSRLIGSVQITGENSIQNPLLYSDDGGATWQQLAQSIANQGQGYTLSSQFIVTNTTIYIRGYQGVGTGGMSRLAGSPSPVPYYWQSTDGGSTWSQVWNITTTTVPGTVPVFVRSATDANYYAISTVTTQIGNSVNPRWGYDTGAIFDTTIRWSADGGATWKPLPDLKGAENGYVIAANADYALAPDGTVYIGVQHNPQGPNDDAGIFSINPNDANPVWRPLVGGGVQWWQATVTSNGLRLWGVGSYEGDTYLKYVDVGQG